MLTKENPTGNDIFCTYMQIRSFMRKIVIFKRIFLHFRFRYWLCNFFFLFIRYLGTLFMFYSELTIFGSKKAKGKILKK